MTTVEVWKHRAELQFASAQALVVELQTVRARLEAAEAELAESDRALAHTKFGYCLHCKTELKFEGAYRCFDCKAVFCENCKRGHLYEEKERAEQLTVERDRALEDIRLSEEIIKSLEAELAAVRGEALEDAARVCEQTNAGLVPPDGGSPTPREMLLNVASDIRNLLHEGGPFVLAPLEPTQAMVSAAIESWREENQGRLNWVNGYKAMLAILLPSNPDNKQ